MQCDAQEVEAHAFLSRAASAPRFQQIRHVAGKPTTVRVTVAKETLARAEIELAVVERRGINEPCSNRATGIIMRVK